MPNSSQKKPSLRELPDTEILAQAYRAAQTGRQQIAIVFFQEMLRRDPQHSFVLLDMAQCHRRLYQQDEMKQALTKVRRHARKDPLVALAYARACDAMRDKEGALEGYRRLEKFPEARVVARVNQLEILERLNRLEECEKMLSNMRPRERKHPKSVITEARLLQRQQKWLEAESLLRGLTEDEDQQICMDANYLLASVLDKQGRQDEAMSLLQDYKQKQGSTTEAEIARKRSEVTHDFITRSFDAFDNEEMKTWRKGGSEEASITFLIGHPRSGTTLMEQALDSHTGIVSADETWAFLNSAWNPVQTDAASRFENSLSRWIREATPEQVSHLRDTYLKGIACEPGCAAPGKHLIDKNPALTMYSLLIMRLLPEAKFIVALRDPRDVIISSFMQNVAMTNWSVNWLTLEDSVEMYILAMTSWLKLRETTASNWIEVRYEDCVKDLPHEVKRITEFLGLDWQDTQSSPHKHVKTKTVFSPTYGDVLKPVYSSSVARWKAYAKHLEPYQEKLAPFVKAFGYEV